MPSATAHGLSVDPPRGWETRIFRRAMHGQSASLEVAGEPAPLGERTFPVAQVATVPIPIDAADYGSDIVDELGLDDALIVLKEFDPEEAAQPLFAREGFPRPLAPADFDTATLQRRLDGQGGSQTFFQEGGRAFCLYVVLGAYERLSSVLPTVNEVLAGIVIEPLDAGSGEAAAGGGAG